MYHARFKLRSTFELVEQFFFSFLFFQQLLEFNLCFFFFIFLLQLGAKSKLGFANIIGVLIIRIFLLPLF